MTDRVLYHLTPSRNLSAIAREGLVPRCGGRSRQASEPRPAIYLFGSIEDVDNALSNWLGDAFEDTPLALIEVRLPSGAVATRVAFEVQVFTPIPPACLRVVSRDYGN